jgi:hypothetical protein
LASKRAKGIVLRPALTPSIRAEIGEPETAIRQQLAAYHVWEFGKSPNKGDNDRIVEWLVAEKSGGRKPRALTGRFHDRASRRTSLCSRRAAHMAQRNWATTMRRHLIR